MTQVTVAARLARDGIERLKAYCTHRLQRRGMTETSPLATFCLKKAWQMMTCLKLELT